QIGRVNPEVGPFAFDGPVEKSLHLLVDLLAQPGDLALGNARHAHGLNEVVNRAGRNALDVSLLNDSRQSLLHHPARLQEARKVAAGAELRNAKFYCSGPRLPVSVAVAVALGQPKGIL